VKSDIAGLPWAGFVPPTVSMGGGKSTGAAFTASESLLREPGYATTTRQSWDKDGIGWPAGRQATRGPGRLPIRKVSANPISLPGLARLCSAVASAHLGFSGLCPPPVMKPTLDAPWRRAIRIGGSKWHKIALAIFVCASSTLHFPLSFVDVFSQSTNEEGRAPAPGDWVGDGVANGSRFLTISHHTSCAAP